jgi:hypothetical protein
MPGNATIDERTAPQPSAEIAGRLDRLDDLARNMDSRFRVPGTNIRFGWDAVLGLVPGIGDIATLGPAGYIWLEGHRMGVSNGVKGRMAVNIALDWAVGSVPLVGDILDVGLKANRRNVALLRDHLAVPAAGTGRTI